MSINFPLLRPDQIEVKVKQITAKGALLLLYKTARTDMDMLDEVIGAENWCCDYKEIKGNLYCGISVRTSAGDWITKWDCGIESRSDGEGNEKKGEASDAAKRAGTRWGIGRELYTSPFIFAKVDTEPTNGGKGYQLKDRFQRFDVKDIGYTDRSISRLVITDDKGNTVFTFGTQNRPEPKPDTKMAAALEHEPASQSQISYITSKAKPEIIQAMRGKYGENLEHLSKARASEAIAKINGGAK